MLAQIPLIISPFIQPPKAVTLPFNYNKLPSSIPPPASCSPADVENIASNVRHVGEFIERTRTELKDEYQQWRSEVERREVEEKRRIAPGYLDTGNRMLQPVRKSESVDLSESFAAAGATISPSHTGPQPQPAQVNEIDKVFGKVSIS